jgi:tRNA(Ile)-lysidine synthetase-like protein
MYKKYSDVLEFTGNDNFDILMCKHQLYQVILKYIKSHINSENLIISLSGGVDSMVLAKLLCIYRDEHHDIYNDTSTKYKIIALHINYKNRPETFREEEFIIDWCCYNNIKLHTHHMDIVRNDQEREFYEKESRRQRYDQYKKILSIYSSDGIFLAHHRGDEQENTFSNIINGKNILSLSAMNEQSIVNNINIFRPFINNTKDIIFDFAHNHSVPYFKDTTPDWSNRGKLRKQIFPLLQDVYGNKFLTNFSSLSHESSCWRSFIIDFIINPFIKTNVSILDQNIDIILTNESKQFPNCFWNLLIKTIDPQISISSKAFDILVYKIISGFSGKIPLSRFINANINDNKLQIIKTKH